MRLLTELTDKEKLEFFAYLERQTKRSTKFLFCSNCGTPIGRKDETSAPFGKSGMLNLVPCPKCGKREIPLDCL